MNYFKISFILFILHIGSVFAGEIREKTKKIIIEKFSDDIEIKTYKLELDKELKKNSEKFARQRFYSKFVYYYEIKKDDKNIAYAILDNVKGKVKPITFLIVFNNNLSINAVEIIKYREEHGGAIENKEWLMQFNNKSLQTKLVLNNNIDGISGATISVKAIIKGVKRLLYLINNLGKDERNSLISVK